MEQMQETAIPTSKDSRILLVCGTATLVSTDTLVNYVRFELHCDPFDGSTYVFCNKPHNHLKWLRWDDGGFRISSRQCEWGTYLWPPNEEGVVIEIIEQEFEFILKNSIIGVTSQSPATLDNSPIS